MKLRKSINYQIWNLGIAYFIGQYLILSLGPYSLIMVLYDEAEAQLSAERACGTTDETATPKNE